jgi:hypothetical protein
VQHWLEVYSQEFQNPRSLAAVDSDAAGVPAARTAVEHLTADGFHSNEVSILIPDKPTSTEFDYELNSKAPEGAAVGRMARRKNCGKAAPCKPRSRIFTVLGNPPKTRDSHFSHSSDDEPT